MSGMETGADCGQLCGNTCQVTWTDIGSNVRVSYNGDGSNIWRANVQTAGQTTARSIQTIKPDADGRYSGVLTFAMAESASHYGHMGLYGTCGGGVEFGIADCFYPGCGGNDYNTWCSHPSGTSFRGVLEWDGANMVFKKYKNGAFVCEDNADGLCGDVYVKYSQYDPSDRKSWYKQVEVA